MFFLGRDVIQLYIAIVQSELLIKTNLPSAVKTCSTFCNNYIINVGCALCNSQEGGVGSIKTL